jgi:hypothetical protein
MNFGCPCGARLEVRAERPAGRVQCPSCGRVLRTRPPAPARGAPPRLRLAVGAAAAILGAAGLLAGATGLRRAQAEAAYGGHVRRALDAIEQSDLDVAARALEEARTIDPDGSAARAASEALAARRTEVLRLEAALEADVRNRRFEAARDVARRLLSLSRDHAEAARIIDQAPIEEALDRAERALERRRWEEVDGLLEPVLARDAAEPRALRLRTRAEEESRALAGLVTRARERLEAREWDEALALCEEAGRTRPDTEGLDALRERARKERERHASHAARAREAREAGSWPEAARAAAEALALKPGDVAMDRLLREARERLGADERRKAVDAHVEQARAALAEGRWEQAEELASAAGRIDPLDPRAPAIVGEVRAARKALDETIEEARRAAEKDLARAREVAGRALALQPSSAEARRLAEELRARADRLAEELAAARRAAGAGQWAAAAAHAQAARTIDPSSAEASRLAEGAREELRWKSCAPCGGRKDCPSCMGMPSAPCGICKGEKRLERARRCIVCNGAGTVPCNCTNLRSCLYCGGAAVRPCRSCDRTGYMSGPCEACRATGSIACGTCSGSGRCRACDGRGKVPADAPEPRAEAPATPTPDPPEPAPAPEPEPPPAAPPAPYRPPEGAWTTTGFDENGDLFKTLFALWSPEVQAVIDRGGLDTPRMVAVADMARFATWFDMIGPRSRATKEKRFGDAVFEMTVENTGQKRRPRFRKKDEWIYSVAIRKK